MKTNKGSLAVPIAIVIAGALIAVAVYFSGSKVGPAPTTNTNGPAPAGILTGDIKVPLVGSNDHILGNPNAPIIFVEYSDTECPFCKQFHATMHKVMDKYGKDGRVAWAYRHFPIDTLHKKARGEAQATECAAKLGGNEKFWSYIDRLLEVTTSNDTLDPAELPKIAKDVGLDTKAFTSCLSAGSEAGKIEEQYQEAVAAGGSGTPFSVILLKDKFDGKKIKEFVTGLIQKYRLPPDLIVISNDEKKISVGGAMPYEIIEQFITALQ